MSYADFADHLIRKQLISPEEFREGLLRPLSVDESKGKPFGRYTILRTIGEGGLGRVFYAYDPLLQRPVAVKVLKRIRPEDVDRFRREARLAADLHHPNIVPVYDAGLVGKQPYIAMAVIEGTSLNRTKPELRKAVEIVAKVARALHYAHGRGTIHRDVKPENVLVDSSGEPFLMDFGMAKYYAGEGSTLTETGSVVGTPQYMSPEQARGQLKSLGPPSDIFSLGGTLYFLLTGTPPYSGESPLEIVHNVALTRPPRPSEIRPGIPADLEAIVLMAMEREPALRYATAEAMAEDLDRYLSGEPVLAARRSRRKFGKILAASVAAVVIVIAALLLLRGGGEKKPDGNGSAVSGNPGPDKPSDDGSGTPPEVAEKPKSPPSPSGAPPVEPVPSPVPELPPRPHRERVDPALADSVRERVLDQPPYYVETFLSEEDRLRALEILWKGRVSKEDIEFLRYVAVEVGSLIRREKRFLESAISEREPGILTLDAPDVVRFKDGRRHQGKVLEETAAKIRYTYRGQTVTVPADMVEGIDRDASSEAQFLRKLEKVETIRDLTALADWCRSAELEPQREYVLYLVLKEDPAGRLARRELGLNEAGPLAGRKAPETEPEPEKKGDRYLYRGMEYTAEELRKTLLKRGYVIVDGQWCTDRAWKWSPRKYWKTNELTLSGTDAQHRTHDELRIETVYDFNTRKTVKVRKYIPKYHYIGLAVPEPEPPENEGDPPVYPARTEGVAEIRVEAPEPFIECRLRAATMIIEGRGEIEVWVRPEGREPSRVYSITDGSDREYHDISAHVRGVKAFTLEARIKTDFGLNEDSRPLFYALFLPGHQRDPEPLSVRAKIAQPVPYLNKLLPQKK